MLAQVGEQSGQFKLGRALGRQGGYRDHFYVVPEAGLQRRFLDWKVRPSMMIIERLLTEVDKERGREVSSMMWQWFELAMSDMGADYHTLD